MKKAKTTLIPAILLSLAFVSCKNDYTCTCELDASIPFFGQLNTTSSESVGKTTKKKADENCEAVRHEIQDDFMGYGTATCSVSQTKIL